MHVNKQQITGIQRMLFWKICRLTCVSHSAFRRWKSTDPLSSFFGAPPITPSPTLSLLCVHSLPCFSSLALLRTLSRCACFCSYPPSLSATPCSSSYLNWAVWTSLHHWFFSLSPASAPYVKWPVTFSASCPQGSSQPLKLPPTPWIIHESVSVFSFHWSVGPRPQTVSREEQHYCTPAENRTSYPDFKSLSSDYSHLLFMQ